jgi:hypothetical protein
MQWESLGFKANPFSTDPITQQTLEIYTGHNVAMTHCQNILKEKNVLLVIEGARGVGTTSFANYLRFSAQNQKAYFTPRNEVRVEPGWSLETLLAVIIANIVREIEIFQPKKIVEDNRFKNAKALSVRIAEAYRSLGIEAFGFGLNYEKTAGITSQPIIVPSSVLGHHLEDLSLLAQSMNYKLGILVQLNNLDIGTIHEEKYLKYLFNAMRDYVQTDGISWLLVGDLGLRRFIAQEVDRLDDIINNEVKIGSMNQSEYQALIKNRLTFYRSNEKAELPIDESVFLYLHEITNGRLRYIFGLLHRLVNMLHVGDLTDRITIDMAKPMIIRLARDRISMNNLSKGEELVLRMLVDLEKISVSELSKKLKKALPYISKILNKLISIRLVTAIKQGKNKYYSPGLDAIIAFKAN